MLKVRPVRLYTAERTDWLGKNVQKSLLRIALLILKWEVKK